VEKAGVQVGPFKAELPPWVAHFRRREHFLKGSKVKFMQNPEIGLGVKLPGKGGDKSIH